MPARQGSEPDPVPLPTLVVATPRHEKAYGCARDAHDHGRGVGHDQVSDEIVDPHRDANDTLHQPPAKCPRCREKRSDDMPNRKAIRPILAAVPPTLGHREFSEEHDDWAQEDTRENAHEAVNEIMFLQPNEIGNPFQAELPWLDPRAMVSLPPPPRNPARRAVRKRTTENHAAFSTGGDINRRVTLFRGHLGEGWPVGMWPFAREYQASVQVVSLIIWMTLTAW